MRDFYRTVEPAYKNLGNKGRLYTGPDPFGTSTDKSCVYTRPGGTGNWICCLVPNGSLTKVILCGTIPFQFRTGPMQTE